MTTKRVPRGTRRIIRSAWSVRPVAGPAGRCYWIVEEDGNPIALIPESDQAERIATVVTRAADFARYVAKTAFRDPEAEKLMRPDVLGPRYATRLVDDEQVARIDRFLSQNLLVLVVRGIADGEAEDTGEG